MTWDRMEHAQLDPDHVRIRLTDVSSRVGTKTRQELLPSRGLDVIQDLHVLRDDERPRDKRCTWSVVDNLSAQVHQTNLDTGTS